jgi:hypothetical protein
MKMSAAAAGLGELVAGKPVLTHFASTVNKPRAKGLIRLLKQPVNFI